MEWGPHFFQRDLQQEDLLVSFYEAPIRSQASRPVSGTNLIQIHTDTRKIHPVQIRVKYELKHEWVQGRVHIGCVLGSKCFY